MKLWEKNVRRVIPYTPGEQPSAANVIKLNTNENPYPPAPGVTAAKDAMDACPGPLLRCRSGSGVCGGRI